MAHEVENMFSVNEIPWHKLGVVLLNAPTIKEAIVAAGLNWEVGTKPLFTDEQEAVPAMATFRKTDNKILGVVGPTYKPLQNAEAFNFFNPFLEAKAATLEAAGSLRGGQRVWVMAKINSEDSVIVPKSDDRVSKYILLSNSHDGTLAVRIGFTGVRVICANTMAAAHNDQASKLIRIKHTGNITENLEKVGEIMNLANAEFEATAEQFRFLAQTACNQSDLEKYVRLVFATKKQEDALLMNGTELTSGSRVLGDITNLFEKGRGNDLPGVKNTLWGAYNSINEYLQYDRGDSAELRLDNMWFGSSATLNKKALKVAVEMAKAA